MTIKRDRVSETTSWTAIGILAVMLLLVGWLAPPVSLLASIGFGVSCCTLFAAGIWGEGTSDWKGA